MSMDLSPALGWFFAVRGDKKGKKKGYLAP
jgi:hypothetical protein